MDNKALLWLDSFDFLTYKKKENILKLVSSPKEILDRDFISKNFDNLKHILGEDGFAIFKSSNVNNTVDNILNQLEKLNIKYITYVQDLYPETLLNIDTPPFVLYYKGDISLLKTVCFAVVGTRKVTSYGKMVTEKFTKGLSKAGFTIVSGLATGVDSISHKETLLNKGKTIAVLAGGIDKIYPESNTNLAKEIISNGGLIISETRPNRKSEPYMFPIRNRIIAALSKGVLITEAHEKSGSLHTKNYALDYGRDVFAVPGSIFSISSVGTNRMISQGHAKLVSDINDILCEYNIIIKPKTSDKSKFSPEEELIINILKEGEKSFQEIVEKTHLEVKKVNSLLTMMTIREIIKKLAGNVYFLNK